ncbi:MAG: hypothetical protein AAF619_02870 [Pseudomonadota bacterium]
MITAAYFYGYLLTAVAIAMAICTAISLAIDPWIVTRAFLISTCVVGFVGGGLILTFRGNDRRLVRSQAYLLAGGAWLFTPIFLSIPIVTSTAELGWFDAYVDAVATFTTTGGVFLDRFDALPDTVKLWRGTSAWLGGMLTIGIVIVILGPSKVGGIILGRTVAAEFRSFTQWQRIISTARRIIPVYSIVTAIVLFVILLSSVDAIDAVVLAFGAISTSGIGMGVDDIGIYGLRTLEFGVFLGMVFGATGFFWMRPLKQNRFRFIAPTFEGQLVVATVIALGIVAGLIFWLGEGGALGLSAGAALWEGVFTAASIVTTSGYELRPGAISVLGYATTMLIVAIGAATVSTSGGQKVFRGLSMAVFAFRELERLVYPHSQQTVAVGPQIIDLQTMKAIWAAFAAYCVAYAVFALAFALAMPSFEPSMLAAVGALSTMLPLYESAWAGSADWPPLAALPTFQKAAMVVAMVAGRVEILALLSLFNFRIVR